MPTLTDHRAETLGQIPEGFKMMDDQLRMSTSLTSEPLSCSALRLFVSRIKRAGWLRVEDQYHVVGGEKATAIPYLSIVRKKNKKEVGRGEALCCFILNASTQSWESFLSRAPTPGEEIFHAALSTAGGWEAKAEGRGWSWKLGKRGVEQRFLEARVCTINRLALDVITGEHWEWKANGSWAVKACSEEAGQLPA